MLHRPPVLWAVTLGAAVVQVVREQARNKGLQFATPGAFVEQYLEASEELPARIHKCTLRGSRHNMLEFSRQIWYSIGKEAQRRS